MAKMFYTQEEAAQRLGVSDDQLKQLVADSKLREFKDNNRIMFKVDQVEKVAATSAPANRSHDSGLDLTPLSGSGLDALSLADSSHPAGGSAKDETIVTSTGSPRSVFSPNEVKPSDTSAQTQIQPAVDDQLSLEGVGSGSGLLDLTRERDDTSLGAELLDEIYPGGDPSKSSGMTAAGQGIGSSSGIFEPPPVEQISGPSGLENMAAGPVSTQMSSGPEIVEARDPSAGAFGGLALASVLAMLVTVIVTAAAAQGFTPSWLDSIAGSTQQVLIFGVILLVVSLLFAGVGFFVGKSATR